MQELRSATRAEDHQVREAATFFQCFVSPNPLARWCFVFKWWWCYFSLGEWKRGPRHRAGQARWRTVL